MKDILKTHVAPLQFKLKHRRITILSFFLAPHHLFHFGTELKQHPVYFSIYIITITLLNSLNTI